MCYFRKGRRRDVSPSADTHQPAAENEITVQVLSVAGEPSFNVPLGTANAVINDMVADRYGWQSIGVRHSWVGLTGKAARR